MTKNVKTLDTILHGSLQSMICQQVTLSGDAEWPKVADAVIEARSWETLSNASAIAEQVVTLVKYSNAMRYIHSGSGIESHLPSESLCLFLCGGPRLRIYCYGCG